MQINIDVMRNENSRKYSDSIANSRLENIGQITWNRAKQAVILLDTPEKINAFKEWVKPFGGWAQDELDKMTAQELNALLVQFISGDIQEIGASCLDDIDVQVMEAEQQAGQVASYLYYQDGSWFYDLTH
jgi:hypothetical protein